MSASSLTVAPLRMNLFASRLNLTALDFERNYNLAARVLDEAKRLATRGDVACDTITLLTLPGCIFTGSGCGDAFLRPTVLKAAIDSLLKYEKIAPRNFMITLGVPLALAGKLYKAHALISDGRLRGFSCATYADLSRRDELRQFTPWEPDKVELLNIGDRQLPVGDILFLEKGVLIDFCSVNRLFDELGETFDPFYNSDTLSEKTLYGATAVELPGQAPRKINVSRKIVENGAFLDEPLSSNVVESVVVCRNVLPFALGRYSKLRKVLARYSRSRRSTVVYPALLGVESGSALYDGGAMIARQGVVEESRRFQYESDASCAVCVSFSLREAEEEWVRYNFSPRSGRSAHWEMEGSVRYEEFARAVSYALFDYMRKCRANGFALSMSGGADSATIATLVRLGVKFGCESGVRNFLRWLLNDSSALKNTTWTSVVSQLIARFPQLEQLGRNFQHWRVILEEGDEIFPLANEDSEQLQREFVSFLLTTFYQSTRNSSEITRQAAREVARACGATHYEFDVDPIIEQYKSMVAEAMNAPWHWDRDDVALQNIQARGRGPSAWLVANKSGRLLLATGNRSEVACGYATMDGDTCGGLSPIAGIDKAFIRKWLVWLEKTGVSLVDAEDKSNIRRFCIPELKFINAQQPTAELRPLETKQTDEADLMPYPILNAFERALIRDRLPFDAAISRVALEAPTLGVTVDSEILDGWGRRFCKLWDASQWKRQRYAPGFLLDDYDLSPSSWCVYPLVTTGFAFEVDK